MLTLISRFIIYPVGFVGILLATLFTLLYFSVCKLLEILEASVEWLGDLCVVTWQDDAE